MANLSVGDVAPSFELPDQQDHPWSLSGQLEVSPVVLVFYRGDWCPYCNGQLAAYARKYNEFERRGTQPAAGREGPAAPPLPPGRLVPLLQRPVGRLRQKVQRVRAARHPARRRKRGPPGPQRQ